MFGIDKDDVEAMVKAAVETRQLLAEVSNHLHTQTKLLESIDNRLSEMLKTEGGNS